MTGNIPKWQQDLADIVNMGHDVGEYLNLRAFLADIEKHPDPQTSVIFSTLDRMAKLIKAANT